MDLNAVRLDKVTKMLNFFLFGAGIISAVEDQVLIRNSYQYYTWMFDEMGTLFTYLCSFGSWHST